MKSSTDLLLLSFTGVRVGSGLTLNEPVWRLVYWYRA